jgi:transcriptional regulator with XRE-family HTH domain
MADKSETVGGRIRLIRNEKALTLDQLAEKAGISKSFLWEVENNRSDISGDKLLHVANVLGASLDFLLRGEPAPTGYQPPKIEIPQDLGSLAEELALTYRQTVTLLEVGQSVIARRSSKKRTTMSKEDWRRLYNGVKAFLEEKQ